MSLKKKRLYQGGEGGSKAWAKGLMKKKEPHKKHGLRKRSVQKGKITGKLNTKGGGNAPKKPKKK